MINLTSKYLKIIVKHKINTERILSTNVNIESDDQLIYDTAWENAQPYSKIPGPNKIQLIKEFMPSGKFYGLQIGQLYAKFYTEYGKLVKIPGIFGRSDMLFSYDANHYQKVFRSEGTFPLRKGLFSLEYYRRTKRPDVYRDITGLVTDQEDVWWKLRSAVNPIMVQPKTVKMYIPVADLVAKDFIEKIKILRGANNEMPENFIVDIQKWALESIGVIGLDKRFGLITENNTEMLKLIDALRIFLKLIYEIEVQPSIWKYYETRAFKQLMASLDTITDVLLKCVNEAVNCYENIQHHDNSELSVLQQILKINHNYAVIMVSDLLLGGIDTTASALAGLLYNLAKNPEKQEILREEVNKILPEKSSVINKESLNNIPYIRASLKESMRLNPIVTGHLRAAGRDITLEGYQVPKNTDILMAYSVLQRDEEYFAQGDSFIPERWLKSEENSCLSARKANPFVYLPFGFGVRQCIGRRFSEMEIYIMISRIMKEFRVEWNYGPFEYTGLINSPVTPLKFKLINL